VHSFLEETDWILHDTTQRKLFPNFRTYVWFIFPEFWSRRNIVLCPGVVTPPPIPQSSRQTATDHQPWGEGTRGVAAWIGHSDPTEIVSPWPQHMRSDYYTLYSVRSSWVSSVGIARSYKLEVQGSFLNRNKIISQNHWVLGFAHILEFQITRTHNILKTGSVSVFRWGEGVMYFDGSLRRS
jgi:hypothetical protein